MNDIINLELNFIPLSRNQLDNMHWTERSKYKQQISGIIKSICKRNGLKKIYGKVSMHIKFIFKDKRKHDLDNYFHKGILDGIKENLIEDDNIDFVQSVYLCGLRGKTEKTIILIRGENE